MRLRRQRAASTKACSIAIVVPSTAAGSSMPQCAVAGCAGQTGQVSPAALSQTVKMKSMCGASGVANAVQLFETNPEVGNPRRVSSLSANGCTSPLGRLPAEKALNLPSPSLLRIASAMIDRAEFPVHKNSTLKGRSGIRFPIASKLQPQQVGEQHASPALRAIGFTARTNALMNLPSTC